MAIPFAGFKPAPLNSWVEQSFECLEIAFAPGREPLLGECQRLTAHAREGYAPRSTATYRMRTVVSTGLRRTRKCTASSTTSSVRSHLPLRAPDVRGDGRSCASARGRRTRGRRSCTARTGLPRSPQHGAKFLCRVRNRKITLVTIPNSHPRVAVTRMTQTSDWRVDPSTQLTLTLRVLATTRAIRITSSATRAPAQV